MARAEAYLLAKFRLDPSDCLATIHQRYRQDRQTDRTDNGPIGRTVLQTVAQKLEALGYISVAESLGISSTTFTLCALKATEVAEITQKTAITPFKVIQGHRL